jgi:hypothetical protein
MLSQFLNRIRFEYIPAIRDREYFEYILENLQETLIATHMQTDDPILVAVKNLNASLSERSKTLRADFERATKIEADVSLPVDPNALFRAFSVNTKWQEDSSVQEDLSNLLSLSLRGDGVQALYVASLLNYIADNSSMFFILGFEEPENSVEYNRAIDLANEFQNTYSKKSQIFLTTHSAAFATLQGANTISYRVYQDNGNTTKIAKLHPSSDDTILEQLSEDIGLFRMQEKLYENYKKERELSKSMSEQVGHLKIELSQSAKPVVYLEGKTDKNIFDTAWNKLHPDKEPICIFKSCDPIPLNGAGGSGGHGTLSKLLCSVLPDNPHIAIGIFDRDKDSLNSFDKLPKHFKKSPDFEDLKISKNGKAAALLLPIPPGKDEYAKFCNLYIEFYFKEETLLKKTGDGKGLVFEQPELITKCAIHGSPVFHREESTHPHTRRIVSGKTIFSEQIVPNLQADNFDAFNSIFDLIGSIIEKLKA